jgi:enoyl-CoA hydratase/carnithine racemase
MQKGAALTMLQENPHSAASDISVASVGRAGVITLSRPRARNALSVGMVRAISAQLKAWEAQDKIESIIFKSNDSAFFSAGGDVRAVALESELNPIEAVEFFRHDYALNQQIHFYKKPVVALVDGIALGAGVGLAAVARHCVVTERAQMAMPETAIGHFTDVGSGWFLNRCPGEVGTWMALTASPVRGSDIVRAGLASVQVQAYAIDNLLTELTHASAGEIPQLLANYQQPLAEGDLQDHRCLIDATFWHDQVEDILAALNAIPTSLTAQWCKALLQASPTSLKITLAHLRRSRGLGLAEVLRQEFNLASRSVLHHEFHAGVRAKLIDKHHNPQWSPATLTAVSQAVVDSFIESDLSPIWLRSAGSSG